MRIGLSSSAKSLILRGKVVANSAATDTTGEHPEKSFSESKKIY